MTMSDPIADMLTRVRNAVMTGHPGVRMPSSKIKVAIVKILKDEGFISDYYVTDERPQPQLVIRLKYVGERRERRPVITGLKRVSKPGCRVYHGCEAVWVSLFSRRPKGC